MDTFEVTAPKTCIFYAIMVFFAYNSTQQPYKPH